MPLTRRRLRFSISFHACASVCWLVVGCAESADQPVVYCSVDETFGLQVMAAFEDATGITPRVVYDSEAGKTTGLINRIRAEGDRPRADVLFSSEIFNTIRLADEGFLASYKPASVADVPAGFRDKQNRWTAIGLRARVLAFDPSRVKREELPQTWEALSQKKWASRLAMANPLFGTTRGHVAAMFAMWGDERATTYLKALKSNGVQIVDGNSAAVRAVIDGRADWCMTDTDDVWVAQRDGANIELIYPDMGHGDTLWIPTTVALIANSRREEAGQKLVDFLASGAVEKLLAESTSRNVPVRPELRRQLKMDISISDRMSYDDIADKLELSAATARDILLK